MPKIYGSPDADTSTYDLLMEAVQGKEVLRILHHQRKPIDARPCQLPDSLMVQAVLIDGTVITARQAKKGAIPRIV